MRKIIFSMLAGMMALGMVAQDGKFTVKSTFEGRGDSVKLMILDVATNKLLRTETLAVTGEMHEVSFDLKDAAMLYVVDNLGGNEGYMSVPAIPGETVLFYREGSPDTHPLRGNRHLRCRLHLPDDRSEIRTFRESHHTAQHGIIVLAVLRNADPARSPEHQRVHRLRPDLLCGHTGRDRSWKRG